MTYGVLVGCDVKQEWLLPWWWRHFQKTNPQRSVAFADFGMSPQARSWCEERGPLIAVPEPTLAKTPNPDILSCWEAQWKKELNSQDLSHLRKTWFKKPIAMLLSPFYRTLWIDLDCQVRGDLTPLFSIPLLPSKMAALSRETAQLRQSSQGLDIAIPYFSAGVVVFEKDSPLISLWVREIPTGSSSFCTEEDLLAFLCAHFHLAVTPLPVSYNWEITKFGVNKDALIYHWIGKAGKDSIRKKIDFSFLDPM